MNYFTFTDGVLRTDSKVLAEGLSGYVQFWMEGNLRLWGGRFESLQYFFDVDDDLYLEIAGRLKGKIILTRCDGESYEFHGSGSPDL